MKGPGALEGSSARAARRRAQGERGRSGRARNWGQSQGREADGTGLQSSTCLHTRVPSPSSLSRPHPHAHTILALLIQGKEMLSAWTGHHKLFFLSGRKKHLPQTVTSSPPSSLLSSSLLRSHGLRNAEGAKDPRRHRSARGCARFPNSGLAPQEGEELRAIRAESHHPARSC